MPSQKQTPLPEFHATIPFGDDESIASIDTAVEDDWRFIIDRAKKWSNEQGFIPSEGILTLIHEGRGLLLRINDEPAGYILTSGGMRRPLIVRHNTVEESLWNAGLGSELMRAVLKWSLWSKRDFILVRTRRDVARQVSINKRLRGLIVGEDQNLGQRGERVDIWSVPRVPTLFASV
jgi:hypothetical protein